jgi:hypothetical protein
MPAEKLTKADAALTRASGDLAVIVDRLSEVHGKLPSHELRGANDIAVAIRRMTDLAESLFEAATGHKKETV